MAKKRQKRHHHRVGAMALSPTSPLVKWGSIAAGFFLADTINTPIDKLTANMTMEGKDKLIAGAEVGIGFLLAFGKAKGKKSLLPKIAGGLLLGAGLKKGLKAFNIISGFRNVPVLGSYNNVPVLGSYNVPPVMNGYKVPPNRRNVMAGVDSHGNGGSGLDCGSGTGLNRKAA